MKNFLMVGGALLVLVVCWLTLREVKSYQEKMDVLLEKVEALESGRAMSVDNEESCEEELIADKALEVVEEVVEVVKKAKPRVEKEATSTQKVVEKKAVQEESVKAEPQPKPKKEINANDVKITQFKKDSSDWNEIITFKNNTSETINRIKGIIVYKDMQGNDISYNEIDIRLTIAPGMSKQTKIKSFDQDNKYCYYKDYKSYYETVGKTAFKIEFRLTSYN
jgi:hypothetical protein